MERKKKRNAWANGDREEAIRGRNKRRKGLTDGRRGRRGSFDTVAGRPIDQSRNVGGG